MLNAIIGPLVGGLFGALTVTPNCTVTGALRLSVTLNVTVAKPPPTACSAI